jgi:hypothetical protein
MTADPLIFEAIRDHLLIGAGIIKPKAKFTLQQLEAQWSTQFERLMKNRLMMGAFRYGLINAPNKQLYDRVAGARKRLSQFVETGNLEFLVDVANLALLEFEEGKHPLRHWGDIHEDHCCL